MRKEIFDESLLPFLAAVAIQPNNKQSDFKISLCGAINWNDDSIFTFRFGLKKVVLIHSLTCTYWN